MIRCIAIDDEPLALRQIASYIEKTPFLSLTGAFNNAMEAIDFLHHETIDLMFVDIEMPDISGMDLVKSLNHPPKIIFTTAYSEYALEGFKVDAVDYLLKPISYADFLKSGEKARSLYFVDIEKPSTLQSNEEYLFIKTEYRVIRINFSDIEYIEGMKEYVRIHRIDAKPIMTLTSMKHLEETLPNDQFMRVHRSYIVNLTKVEMVERNRIIFGEDTWIPISEKYQEVFQDFLKRNFL